MNEHRKSKRLLPWPKVREKVPYTRQHCSRLEKEGLFPKRVQVGGNRVAWLEHEVEDWIEARASEREAA